MNLNIKARKLNTYDAIVVGTGISGGWAANRYEKIPGRYDGCIPLEDVGRTWAT